MRSSTLSITILVALLVAVAPAAHAFDLSGHWSGTYKCKGNYDGEKDGFEEVLEANITQSGSTVGANFTFDGSPYSYNGLAVANLAKPDKGDVMLVICGSDDDLGSTTFDELGRFKVTTKPGKGTGAISGISVYSRSGPPQVRPGPGFAGQGGRWQPAGPRPSRRPQPARP